jgi:hypothetical protein
MNEAEFNVAVIEEKFAAAQVMLYVFSVLQVVAALATGLGAMPAGVAAEASTMQRVSATTNAVINILVFAAAYVLLARCLYRCTKFVWRLAMGVFLLNAGAAALAIAAQPSNLLQVLICILAIAGAISVWRGRRIVRSCVCSDSRS